MVYQYDICSFLILTLVLVSIFVRKLYVGKVHRVFTTFVLIVFFTIIADMFSSAPLSALSPEARRVLREGGSYFFFFLHASILPCYLTFMGLEAGTWYRFITKSKLNRFIFCTPFLINVAAIVTNPWTHAIFSIVDGEYKRGDYILLTYVIGGIYTLFSFYYLKKYRGALDRRSIFAFLSIYPYTILAVVLQYVYPNHLLEMFSFSIAAMTIMFFVIRPEETLNTAVGAKTMAAFRREIQYAYLSRRDINVFIIKVNSDGALLKLYGINMHDAIMRELVTKIASGVRRIVPISAPINVYYLNYGLLAVSVDSRASDEMLAEVIHEALSEKIHTEKFDLTLECAVCDISIPGDMASAAEVASFIDIFEKSSVASGSFIYHELTQQQKIELSFDIDRYIRKAINNRSFQMYYQPIYSVKQNKFVTAEALIRLRDDEVGFISPADFIPAAEKSGAIYEIGDFVIDSVFGFIKKTQPYGVEYIEINISAMQCMNDRFVDDVKQKLTQFGVSNKAVNFELTESASDILDDVLRRTVSQLHAEGIEFSIDDYGTGYSNLQRIMSEPIKIIKIDRSLINSMTSEKTRSVLADTIRMIKSIGIEIVAEGVETEETAQWLIDKGCDFIQGYYYAKPMPEEEYLEFLRKTS